MSAFVHGDSMQLELLNEITLESIRNREVEIGIVQERFNTLQSQRAQLAQRKNAAKGAERKKLTEELMELLAELEILDTKLDTMAEDYYQLTIAYSKKD